MLSLRTAALAAVLPLLASSVAEADERGRWQVGPNDFVNYHIEVLERTDSRLDGFARWGQIDDVAGFFGYEVANGRVVRRPITFETMLFVPFVLRIPGSLTRGTKAKISEVLPATYRLAAIRHRGSIRVGDTRLKGGSRVVDFNGEADLAPATTDKRELGRSFRVLKKGRITWRSTFNIDRGLITDVTYQLSWTTGNASTYRPKSVTDLDPRERTYSAFIRLRLDRVYEHRYEGFQKDVDRAIETGCGYLAGEQLGDGTWRSGRKLGMTAMALQALLDGARDRDEPGIVRGIEWLISQPPRTTYTVGCVMMALEAFRTPPYEAMMMRKGELKDFLPRHLTPKERKYMEGCVTFLLDHAQSSTKGSAANTGADGDLRWGYPRENPGEAPEHLRSYWDNSNTQYAVLGLNSAARCGVPVPDSVWVRIANHFTGVQQKDGPERARFPLVPFSPNPDDKNYAPKRYPARERGWHYGRGFVGASPEPPGLIPYGSMTVAGITSLAIAKGNLIRRKSRFWNSRLAHKVETGIRDGFACLDAMFTTWENPNYDGWYFYYLYGLERAGMIAGIERFGSHDWYWEGAIQLLIRLRTFKTFWSYDQHEIGSTAWAVLFLKRATLPAVITPR